MTETKTPYTTRFEDWEARMMQDPAFRAEVEKLEPEYQETLRRYRQSQFEGAAQLICACCQGPHKPIAGIGTVGRWRGRFLCVDCIDRQGRAGPQEVKSKTPDDWELEY